MHKKLGINELASVLGIKSRVLEADIKDLAWLWEDTVDYLGPLGPLGAVGTLLAIARAYIRGRNCRMGSYQTLWKHLPTKAAVVYHVVKQVVEQNSSFPLYEKLSACGVSSIDAFFAAARHARLQRDGECGYSVLDEVRGLVDEG